MKTKTIIISLIFLSLSLGGWVYADYQSKISVTVPAWYECEIIKFDLVCRTNAQKILINGHEYKSYGN